MGQKILCVAFWKKTAKRWIEDDIELEAMYRVFKDRDCEITLWCISERRGEKRGRKRKTEDAEDMPLSKRASKEERVDEMAESLQEQHGQRYTFQQLQLWARMKLNG